MTMLATELTIEDWIQALRDRHVELVNGELVEQERSMMSGWTASRVATLITNYTYDSRLGYAAAEIPLACFDFISRNHGRKPDAVYYTRESAGPTERWTTPMRVMPQLVVEVLSPSNDALDIDEKIAEYFQAGAELIWVINPRRKSVWVYRRDRKAELFTSDSTITGEHVIPGFSAVVGDFFPPAD